MKKICRSEKQERSAIIYCRVSTKEQAESGYSLAGQEKHCHRYAEKSGFDVIKIFIEKGESAKRADRTELNRLLKFVSKNHKEISTLIVYKLDRLSRNLADYTSLIRYFSEIGIEVASATENVDETPTGRLMKNIIATFAQFENDLRSERTINGMQEAVKEGRWCWQAPIGYTNARDDLNKPTLVHTKEAKFVKMAFSLAESGFYSQIEIVDILKKRGFNRASKQLINKMLNNSLYAGLIKTDWFPEYINAIHKPIIPKDTFYKVQLILDGKRPKITPQLRNNPDFPLRSFVKC